MRQFFLMIIALLLLGLSACDKKQNGTFTVKGRLLQDCSGQPIEGRRISVWEQVQFGHGKDEIGSASTDADGYFELVCPYYSADPKEVQGLLGEYETPNSMQTGDIIDLGVIYSQFFNSVVVKLNIASSAVNLSDTLFIQDVGGSKTDTIYPIPTGGINYHTFSFNYDNGSGKIITAESNLYVLYAGVGIKALNPPSFRNEYHVNFCGQSKDTVTITLP